MPATTTTMHQAPQGNARQAKLLKAALFYAHKGLYVVPLHTPRADGSCSCSKGAQCQNSGKHPRWEPRKLEHGASDATRDPELIEHWWHKWPDANIGIVCGPSRILIADPDSRNGGHVEDFPLTADERQTTTYFSGSGDEHLVYMLPAEWHDVLPEKTSAGPGLDLLAGNTLFVAPPSLHPSGREYRWEAEWSPAEVAIRPAPQALLDLLPSKAHKKHPQEAHQHIHATILSQRFERLLADICQDLDAGRRRGLTLCPFHDDHAPSLSYDIDEAVYYCFSPVCKAHAGGGYKDLKRLALETWGLLADRETASPKGQLGTTVPIEDPPASYPWEILADDWRDCPYCSALHQAPTASGHITLKHWLCGDKECKVYRKIRARRYLFRITRWPAVFIGTARAADWRRIRDQARQAGADKIGIPQAGDIVLVASDRPIVADQEVHGMTEALELLTQATYNTPDGTRIRTEHVPAQEKKDEKPNKFTLTAMLPADVTEGDIKLTVPPDGRSRVLAGWMAAGIEIEQDAGGWRSKDPLTLEQWAALARQTRERRRELNAERDASISTCRGESSHVSIDDGPSSTVPRRKRKRREDPVQMEGKWFQAN